MANQKVTRNQIQGIEKKTAKLERPLLLPCFYFIEVPLFGITAVLAYMLHFTNVFTVAAVDFDPLDVSLSKPFVVEENRSISQTSVYLGATAGPCLIILFVESILFVLTICCLSTSRAVIGSTGCYISASLRRVVRFVGLHLFGILVVSIVCDVIQKNLPSLSPNFLSVCIAKREEEFLIAKDSINGLGDSRLLNASRASRVSKLHDVGLFRSDDCLPALGAKELETGRREFPSYSVTIASFACMYTFLYFRLIATEAGPVATTLITWSTLTGAYALGLLEIAENTSHVASVIAGWVLGAIFAKLMTYEIFRPNAEVKCKCTRETKRRNRETKPHNVFEEATTLHQYDMREAEENSHVSNRDDDGDILRPESKVTSRLTVAAPSPAVSRVSKSTYDIHEDEADRGHDAERNVIKELQNYITETDFRKGLESPRPTQIRELSKGGIKGRRQHVLSTFQAYPSTDEEQDNSILTVAQDIPADLHAAGSASDAPTCGIPVNFQKSSSCEIRPFSFSPGPKSPSSTGYSISDRKLHPADIERPLSYTPLSRMPHNYGERPITMDHAMIESLRKASVHENLNDPRILYFTSDEDEDNANENDKLSSLTFPLVPPPQVQVTSPVTRNDVVNETSNLLREVFDVMNDKQGSTSDSDDDNRDSDGTITGDQSSIVV